MFDAFESYRNLQLKKLFSIVFHVENVPW